MLELSDQNFEKEISSSSKPALVDFYTAWCPPCKTLAPILEKLAEEFKDKIVFFKINIDDNPIVSQKFGIESIPTVILFKNGKAEEGFVGLRPESFLKEWLEKSSSKNNGEKIKEVIKEYRALAEKKGLRLSNEETVKNLIIGLLENEKKYGVRYCPCRRVTGKKEEDESKICPCKFLEKEIEEKGQCLCGLFVK